METLAIVMEGPEQLGLSELTLTPPEADDVVVDVCWSGISTGTERLLYSGKMPAFPGMGYPLVPGYEAVGIVREAGKTSGRREGDMLFVPGARCYGDVHGLFGGAAARIVVPGSRTTVVAESLGEKAALLALAATAYHALAGGNAVLPDLIIGHGVVGRLLARLTLALGGEAPTVVEANPLRRAGALGYPVIAAEDNDRRDYRTVYDASGDPGILDSLIQRLGLGGEIVLAGFYAERLSFAFPAAFMREARLRVAAEWKPDDLSAVMALIGDGRLSLDGLITHEEVAYQAVEAYDTAFNDPACLKMILDWRFCS